MNRGLIGFGLLLVLVGLCWPWLSRIGWGRLPGDLVFTRNHTRVVFPITTCLLLSALASLLWWLWRR